jgi:hypothetical protein
MRRLGICFDIFFGVFLSVLIAAGLVWPADAQERSVGGEWTGKYVCGQGVTGARLVVSDDGSRGVFHFYPLPENPTVPAGCFQVAGVFNPATGALAILPTGTWYLKPRNYLPAAFSGTVDSRGEGFSGKVVGLTGCASIFLSREAPTVPLPSVCARGLP